MPGPGRTRRGRRSHVRLKFSNKGFGNRAVRATIFKRGGLPAMILAHPLGVKPTGNALLDDSYSRVACMGQLGLLNDDVLMLVLQELPQRDLLAVSHTCKALYAYGWFDELWKQIVYGQPGPPEEWRGSWRRTALQLADDTNVDASGKVYSDWLFRPFELSQINYWDRIRDLDSHAIMRVEEQDMTWERFVEHGAHKRPFVAQLEHPIAEWTMHDLVNKFGAEVFRQEYMDWPLRLYAQYMRANMDETPLYLFDCRSAAHKALVFETPLRAAFGTDYFTLLGADRPDHQWLIVGPERSGSTFHKDPNGTSAWNSTVSGHKYWIMFPPSTPPPGVWTNEDQSEVTAPVSLAEWFSSGFYEEAVATKGFCHAITGPAECMYVPSGWWHAVVNLDECVAMTGNFVPEPQLETVLAFLKNKPDQISGFDHPEGLYEKFKGLLGAKGELRAPAASKRKWNEVEDNGEKPFTFSFSV